MRCHIRSWEELRKRVDRTGVVCRAASRERVSSRRVGLDARLARFGLIQVPADHRYQRIEQLLDHLGCCDANEVRSTPSSSCRKVESRCMASVVLEAPELSARQRRIASSGRGCESYVARVCVMLSAT